MEVGASVVVGRRDLHIHHTLSGHREPKVVRIHRIGVLHVAPQAYVLCILSPALLSGVEFEVAFYIVRAMFNSRSFSCNF